MDSGSISGGFWGNFGMFFQGLKVYVCKLLGRHSLTSVLKVSRTLLTLPRYSGQWAPLPSDLSGTCLYRYIVSKGAQRRTATVPWELRLQRTALLVEEPVFCVGAVQL